MDGAASKNVSSSGGDLMLAPSIHNPCSFHDVGLSMSFMFVHGFVFPMLGSIFVIDVCDVGGVCGNPPSTADIAVKVCCVCAPHLSSIRTLHYVLSANWVRVPRRCRRRRRSAAAVVLSRGHTGLKQSRL